MPPQGYTPEHCDIFYMRTYMEKSFEPLPAKKLSSTCVECDESRSKSSKEASVNCFECGNMCHIDCLPDKASPSGRWFCQECSPQFTAGTCWIPLGDVDIQEGVPAFLHTSNRTIPHMGKELKMKGAGRELPFNYFKTCKTHTWHTGPFDAGDVILFDSQTVHCSATNKKRLKRLE